MQPLVVAKLRIRRNTAKHVKTEWWDFFHVRARLEKRGGKVKRKLGKVAHRAITAPSRLVASSGGLISGHTMRMSAG